MISSVGNENDEHRRSVAKVKKKPRKKFPAVLHSLMEDAGRLGTQDVLSWCLHGRAFRVHQKTEFVRDIMPNLFRHSRWASFQRQLNLYGFTRILTGGDKGAYYHPLFLRGKPSLCDHIERNGTAESLNARQNESALTKTYLQPDFYSLPPIGEPVVTNDSQSDQSPQHTPHPSLGSKRSSASSPNYMKLDTESYCSSNKFQLEVKQDEVSSSSSLEGFANFTHEKERGLKLNTSEYFDKLHPLLRNPNSQKQCPNKEPLLSQINSENIAGTDGDAISLSDDPQQLRRAFAICGGGGDFDVDRLLSLPDWFEEMEPDW